MLNFKIKFSLLVDYTVSILFYQCKNTGAGHPLIGPPPTLGAPLFHFVLFYPFFFKDATKNILLK
jgi:hypothetical protein